MASAQGGTLLLGVLLANILGRQGFGRFAMVQSTVLTVAAISQLAMGYTATKYIAEFRSTDRARAGRLLALCSLVGHTTGLVTGAAVFFAAPAIAAGVLAAPELTWALRFAGVAVLFYVGNGFQAGALAGLEAYPLLARAGAASGLTFVLVCSMLALAGGVTAAAAGIAMGAAIQYLIYRRLLRGECERQAIRADHAGIRREWAALVNFAVPAALSGFSTLPALWVCNAMLARSDGGFGELALYVAANNFRVMVLFLPNVISGASGSLLNNQRGVGDDRRYEEVLRSTLQYVAVAAVAGALFVSGTGPLLLALFGSEFPAAYAVLLILAGAAVLEALGGAAYLVVQSHARLWLSFAAIALPRDLLVVGLAFWLIPARGASGFALAFAGGALYALISTTIIVARLGLGIVPRTTVRAAARAEVA
jgi:O-antigen/teichoic acid export membrane protein